MKSFRFNLQTVLEHRMALEEKERNELGRLLSHLRAARNRLEDLQRRQHRTLQELVDVQKQEREMQDFSLFCAYLERLKVESNRTRAEIVDFESKADAQKKVVVEATRRRKLLETLRTRRHKEYVTAAEAEEQKAVDEMVVARYAGDAMTHPSPQETES